MKGTIVMMKAQSRFTAAVGMLAAMFATGAVAMTKIGIVTDTHIGAHGRATQSRLEQSYRLFKSHGVTNIFNLGDIADRHVDAWYQQYVDVRERVYPEGVNEVFVYHNHDYFGFPNDDKQHIAAFEAAQRKLGAKNGRYHAFMLEGCHFFSYPLGLDYERLDNDLTTAEKDAPDKPIFVLNHVPPVNTSAGSAMGDSRLRAVLAKHPQIVALTGHVHGSSVNEAKIWQGEFTAIGFGALKEQAMKDSTFYVSIIELDEKRAVIRRYAIDSGKEYRPDRPWILEFPFDPKNPRYSHEVLAKTTPQPHFGEHAHVHLESGAIAVGNLLVSFPCAQNPEWVSHYDVQIEDHDHDHDHPRSVRRVGYGAFAVPEEKRPKDYKTEFDSAYFHSGEKVKVSVTPEGFFKNRGEPISADWDVGEIPTNGWTTLFDALPKGATAGEFVSTRKKFPLPNEVWKKKPGTLYRFTIDMEIRQTSDAASQILITGKDKKRFTPRTNVQAGEHSRRYVFLARHPKYRGPYWIEFWGGANEVKFDSFKIECHEK